MRAGLVLLLVALATGRGAAQVYHVMAERSAVTFRIKNFGISVHGKFSGVQGAITLDAAKTSPTGYLSIRAATVDTGNSLRDKHLRGESFLHAEAHPFIVFATTAVAAGPAQWRVTGTLTLKGTAQTITVVLVPVVQHNVLTLRGDMALARQDFGVGGDALGMGDTVYLHFELYARPSPP